MDATEFEQFRCKIGGIAIHGNLYVAGPCWATAIVTGPLTSVKEQASGGYARALSERGVTSLAIDHRFYGSSGGEPRQLENPFAKIDDIRAAAQAIKRDKRFEGLPCIGVGVCAGGGYMAGAVADDPLFEAFAGIAGYYSEVTEQSLAGAAEKIARGEAAERRWRESGINELIPAVGPPGTEVAMPLAEAFEYYGTTRGAGPNYVNAYSVISFAYTPKFNAIGAAKRISVPVLMVHSDAALAPGNARRFYNFISSTKSEIWLSSNGQIDFYDSQALINASCDAIAQTIRPKIASAALA